MSWPLVIAWLLGGGLLLFTCWDFGLAAIRIMSGRRCKQIWPGRAAAPSKRPASCLLPSRAMPRFPHDATGIEPVPTSQRTEEEHDNDIRPINDAGPRPHCASRMPIGSRRWVAPVVIAALLVGGAGLGVGAYAVATTPAKTSGPQGRTGATGAQGPQGVKGAAGSDGARRADWDYRCHHDSGGHLAQVGARSRCRDCPRSQDLLSLRKGPVERWCSGHRPWCPCRPQRHPAVLVSDQLNEMADGCDRDRAAWCRCGHDHDALRRVW